MDLDFLKILKKHNIEPNFWCSKEYFEKSNWKWMTRGGWYWVVDPKGTQMLPRVYSKTGVIDPCGYFFAGFPGVETRYFLDYQYIFRPLNFKLMKGKKWAVFRKNARKWLRGGGDITYRRLWSDDIPQVIRLLENWTEGKTIYDPEIMVKYSLQGENVKGLFRGEQLAGYNCWDSNYRYINFRYCVCDESPFISECLRRIFYLDDDILNENKLVNDGGCLGNKGLENFKDKMNPSFKKEIFTWERKVND